MMILFLTKEQHVKMPYFYDGDLKTVIAKRKLDRYRLAFGEYFKGTIRKKLTYSSL